MAHNVAHRDSTNRDNGSDVKARRGRKRKALTQAEKTQSHASQVKGRWQEGKRPPAAQIVTNLRRYGNENIQKILWGRCVHLYADRLVARAGLGMEQYQIIYFWGDCWDMVKDKTAPLTLVDVMSTQEAAERWGKENSSVKHLCTGVQGRPPRLTAEECRKSGGVWLVTRAGMERLYGEENSR